MGADAWILLVIVVGSVLASAIHKRRNLDLPAREPDRSLSPHLNEEPLPDGLNRRWGGKGMITPSSGKRPPRLR